MTNFSLFGTKLVWPSSAAGQNINKRFFVGKFFGFKTYKRLNAQMIVVYGKKGGSTSNELYLFSYSTKPAKSNSPSEPSIAKLSPGFAISHSMGGVSIKFSTPSSEWKNSGDKVDFKLLMQVTPRGGGAIQTVTEHVTGSLT
jgi:hypothetical protein